MVHEDCVEHHQVMNDNLGVVTKDNFGQHAWDWIIAQWVIWCFLGFIVLANFGFNIVTMNRLVHTVEEIRINLVEYKVNLGLISRVHLAMIFSEIAETAEVTAQQTMDSIMSHIDSGTEEHMEINMILAPVALAVEERRNTEYSKLTQLGVDNTHIQFCKDTDQETFPELSLMLGHMVQEAEAMVHEDVPREYIYRIMDKARINAAKTIRATWESHYRNKTTLR